MSEVSAGQSKRTTSRRTAADPAFGFGSRQGRGPIAGRRFDEFFKEANISVEPVTLEQPLSDLLTSGSAEGALGVGGEWAGVRCRQRRRD